MEPAHANAQEDSAAGPEKDGAAATEGQEKDLTAGVEDGAAAEEQGAHAKGGESEDSRQEEEEEPVQVTPAELAQFDAQMAAIEARRRRRPLSQEDLRDAQNLMLSPADIAALPEL
jgi:hypothetical protein